MATRVLVVDDHQSFRTFARALLINEGFDVVAEACDAASALRAAAEFRPDLVLLDVRLPDGDGFGVAEAIAAMTPHPPVVVLCSSREAAAYRRRLAGTAAAGFVAKRDLSAAALRAFVP
jgi:DNA-binding NarL/FixJ family response regulator